MGGLKDLLGMETPELLGRIFGGEEGSGGWAEAIPKVLGSLAEIGKVALAGEAAPATKKAQVALPPEKQVAIQTPEGIKMVPASMLQQIQQEMADQREATFPPLPDFPIRPPDLDGEPTVIDAEAEKVPETDFVQAAKVNTLRRAKEKGLELKDQKKARKAIRKLVEDLRDSDEEKWSEITTTAVTETIEIYAYIKAVGIYAALAEGKADEELTKRIAAALKESGLIPDDIPYTEEEVAKLKEGGEE